MCGISGYISKSSMSDIKILDNMVASLYHRGPDDKGSKIYDVEEKKIGLGQARLSIIDLSHGGHQPMEYKDLSIVFNGEIYNYKEIKKELELLSHKFISNSDTEVILHAFDEWGLKSVDKFIGMFAFSILDKRSENLYIFRDRVGIKPLYYYQSPDLFLFASELKSFHKHPGFKKEIDIASLKLYFDFGNVPAPYTIFNNCNKLEPGMYLMYNLKTSSITLNEYWSVNKYYALPKLDISYNQAKQELHTIFKSAFNYRMIADVPVGVFLSGGYDSTAVTAILQKGRTEKLKTFTIGFEEGNNEAPYAKETAAFLGTDHSEYYFSAKEAQKIIPELPYYYDEPFFDSSALPTIMVSKLARKEVTVALSADGGDEMFAGYNSYVALDKWLKKLNAIPNNCKKMISKIAYGTTKLLSNNNIDLVHKLEGISTALDKNRLRQGLKLFNNSQTLPSRYCKRLFAHNADKHETIFDKLPLNFHNEMELAMAVDYQMYLPNDILTKVDRATMSVSLEGREPLLDHRIVEFAAQLPFEYKFDGISTKKILKDIVHDYIPKEMMNRPKTGFSVPIYTWLRSDLSYLLETYMSKEALTKSGIFNVDFVLEITKLFKNDKLHYITIIWKILMFQMWYDKWMNNLN